MEEARDNNVVRKVIVDGDEVHVTLRGEIDAATSPMLQRLLEQLSESTTGAVLVDMSGVSFIDSMGLRVLVHIHQRLSARGRLLILCDVSTSTLRLLEVSGLRQSLNVFGPT